MRHGRILNPNLQLSNSQGRRGITPSAGPGFPAFQEDLMRLWFGLFALIAFLGTTMAADTIPATGGNIELTPLAHAHVQIEFGGKVIHIDPNAQAPFATAKPADIVLITDIHGDHMDPASID